MFYKYLLGPFDKWCHLILEFLSCFPHDLYESQVLKLSTISVLVLICIFKSNSVFLMKFNACVLFMRIFRIIISYFWSFPLMSRLSLCLKYILSDDIIATPSCFLVPFAWDIFHICLSWGIILPWEICFLERGEMMDPVFSYNLFISFSSVKTIHI